MDNSKRAFFELVKAGLFPVHGEGVMVYDSLFKDVDWEKVFQLAQEQSVQGLLLQGIEVFKAKVIDLSVPKVLLLQWIGEVQVIEQRNKEMNAFIAELIDKLRKADIYALLVKGQGGAQCYENPLWRSSGDVDLLLSADNYEKAKTVLMPIASEVETEYEGISHLGMTIDEWVVELHGSLRVGLPQRINRVLDDIQEDTFYGGNVRSWLNGQTQIFMLGKENDIVYVFVHFFNHFYKEGVGLRQICDWCRLLYTYRDEINRKLLEQRLKSARLIEKWKVFAVFAVEYLGMPADAMPFYCNSRCLKRKANMVMTLVMDAGNFGQGKDLSSAIHP